MRVEPNYVKISDDLYEVDGRVRLERGPCLCRETATEELLADDRTARHYVVGGIDRDGNPIVLGKEMSFLDYLKPYGWYVYLLEADPTVKDYGKRWKEKAFFQAEPQARAFATTLL